MSDPKNIEAPEAPKTDCDLRTRQKRGALKWES
jgi:hypothetical protein